MPRRKLSGAPARALRAGVAVAALALLGACASQPASRQAQPRCALDYAGRISVVQHRPGVNNLYGSFELRLDADTGWLELATPLGQVLARASWGAGSASVDDGHGVRDFASFEDMTQATLGLRLPRAALRDWVRGVPASSLPWRALPPDGFEQLGWRVTVLRRDARPHVLRLSRGRGDDAEQLALVIDSTRRLGAGCRAPATGDAAGGA